MATRFYLPSTGAAAVSPAYAAWDDTAFAGSRLKCVTARIGSAMTNQSHIDNGSGTPNTRCMWRQWVSDPIGAQTVSGTLKGQLRAMDDGTGYNRVSLCVKVVSNDGTTLRGTLLALGEYFANASFAASLTNRKIADGDALSSVVASANDRIVIELGCLSTVGATDLTGTMSMGDDSGTDLAEDESTTTANNAWVEFSGDLFPAQTSTPSAVGSSGATLAGGLMAGVVANASIGAALAGGLAIGVLAVDCVGLAGGPNSVKYSVLAADSVGSAVTPESADVVLDSYDPEIATAQSTMARATTPASLGDADMMTGESAYVVGPATGTFSIVASVMNNPVRFSGDTAISHVVFQCVGVFDEGRNLAGFPQDVSQMRMKWTLSGITEQANINLLPMTDDWSGLNAMPFGYTAEIPTKPGGGAWTFDSIDALVNVTVEADYDLPGGEVLNLYLMEIALEVYGPQGSFVAPLVARLKCGNLQRRLSVAETFGL